MAYPTDLDTFTTHNTGDVIEASYDNAQQVAISALEAKVGVDSSAVTTSHDYKLSGVTGSDKAVSKTGTETLTNKTLTSPIITSPDINLGSDATGDIFYRNSSGHIARLPVSTDGKILKLASGLPSWATETVTNDASTTVKGIVEAATSAEVTAGTATGGTGAVLVVTPDALAASTPVFNGSGLTNVVSYKCGTTTKDAADASTTQTIAHGLGKTPKKVNIFMSQNTGTTASGYPVFAKTVYNGTTQASQSQWAGASTAITVDNSFTINTNTATSDKNVGVVTFDSTNITITWTRTGSSSSGVYQLLWEAEA